MPYCRNCGSQISETAIFCPQCGYKRQAGDEEQSKEPARPTEASTTWSKGEKRSSSFIPLIAGSSISIIVGVIISYLLLAAIIYSPPPEQRGGGLFEAIGSAFGMLFKLILVRIFETYGLQLSGMFYYASHGIPIVSDGSGVSMNFNIFSAANNYPEILWLLLIPIISLVIGGFVSARISKAHTTGNAFKSGASICIPYAVLMVLLTFVFSINLNPGFSAVSIHPEIGTTFIVGLIFGAIFGGFGGIFGRTDEHINESKGGEK